MVRSCAPFCLVAPGVSCPPDGADGFAIGVLPPAPWPAAPLPPPCDSATVVPAASAKAATDISNVRFMSSLLGEIPAPSVAGPTRPADQSSPRFSDRANVWNQQREGTVAKLASVVDAQGKEFRDDATAAAA